MTGNTSDDSVVVNSPVAVTGNYVTQYQVSLEASPPSGGMTNPPTGSSQWYNAGSTVGIQASPATGYSFQEWSLIAGAPLLHILDSSAADTSVVVNGSGIVQADFQLIQSTTISTTTTSTQQPTGVPQFPGSLIIVVVAILFVSLSYARKRTRIGSAKNEGRLGT